MLREEVLVERAVVVKLVAAGARAGLEAHTGMARPVLGDLGVAVKAEVLGLRNTHRAGHARPVLDVTRDAQRGVELFQPVRVPRVGEFRQRMRIVRRFQLGPVAAHAGFLQRVAPAEARAVARLAGELDLVMAVRSLARQQERARRRKQRAVGGGPNQQPRTQVSEYCEAEPAPDDP